MQPLFCWHSLSGPCANPATGSYECHHPLPLTHKNTHGVGLLLSLTFTQPVLLTQRHQRGQCFKQFVWIDLKTFLMFLWVWLQWVRLEPVSGQCLTLERCHCWRTCECHHNITFTEAMLDSHTHSHTDSHTPSLIYSHCSGLPTFPSAKLRVDSMTKSVGGMSNYILWYIHYCS